MISFKETASARPRIDASVMHTSQEDDKTAMTIFAIAGKRVNNNELAQILSDAFQADVNVSTYTGVAVQWHERALGVISKFFDKFGL